MRSLISVRSLAANACRGLSKAFEASGICLPEHQLLQYVADGRIGGRRSVIAEVQVHVMAPAGMASVRFGFAEEGAGHEDALAELTDLIVLPRYRRNGVATKLLDVIEREISEKATWLVVRGECFHNREAGLPMLAERGYTPAALRGAGFEIGGKFAASVSSGLLPFWVKRTTR